MENEEIKIEPPVIIKLKNKVINRIAAGEMIHDSSSVLKELIENSLDSKCTQIEVILKDGGLNMLQVQDDGTGINKKSFPILCYRFTTNKLREFSELQQIRTLGFRGEALASISHVSRLKIISKTSKNVKSNYQLNL